MFLFIRSSIFTRSHRGRVRRDDHQSGLHGLGGRSTADHVQDKEDSDLAEIGETCGRGDFNIER